MSRFVTSLSAFDMIAEPIEISPRIDIPPIDTKALFIFIPELFSACITAF